MGDVGDDFREVREYQQALRDAHGVDCPGCRRKQPKRIPTVMLPQQRCKVCGYRDPRARLTDEQCATAAQQWRERQSGLNARMFSALDAARRDGGEG